MGSNELRPDEQNNTSVNIDPTSPETVYAAGDGLGLFRTTDGGTSWRRLNLGVNKMPGMDRVLSPRWFNAIAIDPSVQGTVYAASNDNFFGHFVTGVFKTTDGRDTWTPFMAGQAARQIDALAIDPTNTRSLYAGTFNIGIFKTTDGAASLSEINSGLTKVVWYPSFDSIAIAPSNAAIVYAGRPSGGLYKSTDGGMKIHCSWFERLGFWSIDQPVKSQYRLCCGGYRWY